MDRIIRNDRFHVFDVLNPTMGTGIVMGTEAAYAETKALLSHFNPANSQMHHVPEFLRIEVSDAGVATAGFEIALVMDVIDRHTGGGSQLTPADRTVEGPRASGAEIHFGALTLAAADAAAKRFAQRVLKSAALAVGDVFEFDFAKVIAGINLGKLVISPGNNLALHAWAPSQSTPPQFEVAWRWREVQQRT